MRKRATKPLPKRGAKSAKSRRPIVTVAGQPTLWPREIKLDRIVLRQEMGDVAGLARSIDERGCLLHPLAVALEDGVHHLIAGQRRLAAWALSKFRREPIPVHIVSIDDILAGEVDENKWRKDFTPSESVALLQAGLARAKALAKDRMRAGGKVKAVQEGDTVHAKDMLARYTGLGRVTLEKAEKIVAAAKADPEKFGPLREQMDRTGKVNGPFKRLENIQRGEQLRAAPPPAPMAGPYHTVVIDFPWPADLDGYRDQDARGYYPYATMTIAKIVEYAQREIAPAMHPDGCAVWLWIPNFHLVRGCHIPVLKALGAEGSTMLTWIKPELGQGQRMRGATEHAILAIRGKVPVLGTEQRTWFEAPAGDKHSAKPEEFFRIAEAITPAPRYAYFFAGADVPENWDGHGDRVRAAEPEARSDTHNSDIEKARDENAQILRELSELEILERVDLGRVDANEPCAAKLKAEKLARGSAKLKLTKLGIARLKKLREENSKPSGDDESDRGQADRVGENEISQPEAEAAQQDWQEFPPHSGGVDCRVCADGTSICAECVAAADHDVVSTDDDADTMSCRCGFTCSQTYGGWEAQKQHWQAIVAEAKAAAASTDELPDQVPDFLHRRARAEAAE